MSYYGKIDKKSIVNILDNGLGFLKDELRDQSRSGDTNLSEFYKLEKLLYNEGSQLLSMTNKVRFEKRLNTIRKNLDKFRWGENIMELKYTEEEIKEAGKLVLVELGGNGVTTQELVIEKVSMDFVCFNKVVTVLAVTFGHTKKIAKQLIFNPKVRARADRGFIHCSVIVLEKDIDVAIGEIKKVASQKIDDKMKQLEIQRDLVNSL